MAHQSVADIHEKNLIRAVISDPTIFNVKGIDFRDGHITLEQPLRDFRADLTGEVDIISFPKRRPDVATSIQVKRFKAKVDGHDAKTGHRNRMRENFTRRIGHRLRLGCSDLPSGEMSFFERPPNPAAAADERRDDRGRVNTKCAARG
jgi:hypothetical protein